MNIGKDIFYGRTKAVLLRRDAGPEHGISDARNIRKKFAVFDGGGKYCR